MGTKTIHHSAYTEKPRFRPHVQERMDVLLTEVAMYPNLTVREYAFYVGVPENTTRTDLIRLWTLGLVRRYRNRELAIEDGTSPMTWYWEPVEPGGDGE